MFDVTRDQVTALCALMTATQQVHELAYTGNINQHILVSLEKSLFDLEPKTISDIYDSTSTFRQGALFLQNLSSPSDAAQPDIAQPMHYGMSLIQLAKELMSDSQVRQALQAKLKETPKPEHFDDWLSKEFIDHLAMMYVDTIGKLGTRIQVKGQPEQLKKDGNPERIRSLLLCGIRAAYLWLQLGGNRTHFFLSRKKIADIASTI